MEARGGGVRFARLAEDEDDEGAPPPPAAAAENGTVLRRLLSLADELAYGYIARALDVATGRSLEHDDLPPPPAELDVAAKSARFKELYAAVGASKFAGVLPVHRNARLFVALMRLEAPLLWRAFFCKLIHDMNKFISPVALQALLKLLQGSEVPAWVHAVALSEDRATCGYVLVVILVLTALFETFMLARHYFYGFQAAISARAVIVSACYDKVLRMSSAARTERGQGNLVTLVSADAGRLTLTPYLHFLWSSPLQLTVSIMLLNNTIGVAFWAGLGAIAVLMPMNAIIAKKMGAYAKQMMSVRDARQQKISEALGAIKMVKAGALEEGFANRVRAARAEEVKALFKVVGANMMVGIPWEATPLIVATVTFVAYSLSGGTLVADKVFTALALFDIIKFAVVALPQVMMLTVQLLVALNRLQGLLDEPDTMPDDSTTRATERAAPGDAAIKIRGSADFAWSPSKDIVLRGISLDVGSDELLCVLGVVGCGKTSLLHAILGELDVRVGKVSVSGSVAYVAQTPFIMAATVKENILFGKPYDDALYKRCVAAADLGSDLELLTHGDATEIGQNGVNLSGGQRQRVALARAAYRQADVYLLDDPLSAVDAHVGAHIFNELICGLLKGTARVLVTHGLQYLPDSDRVIILRDGSVVEGGTYSELSRVGSQSELASMLKASGSEANLAGMDGEAEDKLVAAAPSEGAAEPAKKEAEVDAKTEAEVVATKEDKGRGDEPKQITEEEKRAQGRVSLQVFITYLHAVGEWQTVLVIFGFAGWTGGVALSKYWLAIWADDESDRHSEGYWLGGYLAIGAASLMVLIARQILRIFTQIRGGVRLHEAMLGSLIERAPLSFFSRNPQGRILNRFAGDMQLVDENLHDQMCDALRNFFTVLVVIVVIGGGNPFVLLLLPVPGYIFAKIQQRYISAGRDLQRLDSTSNSPVIAHFSEAVTGATTVRAFCDSTRFVRENWRRIKLNATAQHYKQVGTRWLSLRIDAAGSLVIGAVASLAVARSGQVAAGVVGLSVSYSLQITDSLGYLIRAISNVETSMVAVERIREFILTEPEPDAIVPQFRPPPGWPAAGTIELKNLSMRYRADLPRVLDSITCSVPGGSKVGVCGRTGAGKSSLILALLRLTDAAGLEGSVLIDNVDVFKLGVSDLRSVVSVIPQEPLLFAGSLRFNVDPLEEHDDAELMRVLRLAQLDSEFTLDAEVAQDGGNLSQGQRQLLCISRAALRKSRIVMADEATASLDVDSDAAVQIAIRQAFKSCTVLTIAHRLNTIADSTHIMVLERGRLAEFASPEVLLQTEGIYRSLVDEANRQASR